MWWGIFIVSVSSLVLLVLRSRAAGAWLMTMALHMIVAAVLLYIVNGLGVTYDFRIPINAATIATIGVLGIPGLAMLVALKTVLL
ncbi:pro-sigmaK processing inhibitor BofA family protein [Gorillibacterium sp. sgz5001074]|uniref:pro-sigmaK processing inhibitor BofA family protein n=1 Tax=Gorillibacterium sp. sgz5001074 TaxID=3446695 RepID=UPI003F675061